MKICLFTHFLTFPQLPSKAHFPVLDCNECSRRGLDTDCLICALTSETTNCPTVGASLCDCYAKTPPSLNWVSSRSTWPCVFTPFVELDHHLDQFTLIAYSYLVSHWNGIYLYFHVVQIQNSDPSIITTVLCSLKLEHWLGVKTGAISLVLLETSTVKW